MNKALNLAHKAAARDEVPVGAVIVKDGELLALGSNRREQWNSPLGHAELIALQRASQKLQSWRLQGCTLYVTLEPCVICAGAVVLSRIDRVIYGSSDVKGGALESLFQLGSDARLNHRFECISGVLQSESSELLKSFFQKKRKEKK